jgi:hypothetical protein
MKKLLQLILACSVLSLMATGFGLSQAATHKHDGGWLYVVSSGKAYVHKLPGHDQYALTMYLPDLDQVTKFSDRPLRIVRYMSARALKSIWKEGDNSFKVDPPNAVLFAKNLRPVIVVIKSAHVHHNRATYIIETPDLFGLPESLHKVTLSIDSGCGNGGDFPAGG